VRVVHSPNVGSCDYTYALHLSTLTTFRDEVVLFIKDTTYVGKPHNLDFRFRSLRDVLEEAAEPPGYGCGVEKRQLTPHWWPKEGWRAEPSLYWYSRARLETFFLKAYNTSWRHFKQAPYTASAFANLGQWWRHIRPDGIQTREVLPVCYGGAFAFRESNARHVDWASLLPSLQVGEVNHFMERTWAALLLDLTSRPMPMRDIFFGNSTCAGYSGARFEQREWGLMNTHGVMVCCPTSCGQCGGKRCGERPGGEAACCGHAIMAANRSCLNYPPPCAADSSGVDYKGPKGT